MVGCSVVLDDARDIYYRTAVASEDDEEAAQLTEDEPESSTTDDVTDALYGGWPGSTPGLRPPGQRGSPAERLWSDSEDSSLYT